MEAEVEENGTALKRLEIQHSKIIDSIKGLHEQKFFHTTKVVEAYKASRNFEQVETYKAIYINNGDEFENYEHTKKYNFVR